MLVEHVVRLRLLLLASESLNLSSHLGQLGAVHLLLVGDSALILAGFGIVTASEGICLSRLGLQLALQVVGLFSLARLLLL
jgi:hypothetical protein